MNHIVNRSDLLMTINNWQEETCVSTFQLVELLNRSTEPLLLFILPLFILRLFCQTGHSLIPSIFYALKLVSEQSICSPMALVVHE